MGNSEDILLHTPPMSGRTSPKSSVQCVLCCPLQISIQGTRECSYCVFTHVQTCAHGSMYCVCVLSLRVWDEKTSELTHFCKCSLFHLAHLYVDCLDFNSISFSLTHAAKRRWCAAHTQRLISCPYFPYLLPLRKLQVCSALAHPASSLPAP